MKCDKEYKEFLENHYGEKAIAKIKVKKEFIQTKSNLNKHSKSCEEDVLKKL